MISRNTKKNYFKISKMVFWVELKVYFEWIGLFLEILYKNTTKLPYLSKFCVHFLILFGDLCDTINSYQQVYNNLLEEICWVLISLDFKQITTFCLI